MLGSEYGFYHFSRGVIECHWGAFIENLMKTPAKPEDNPFYILYARDVLNPGEETTVKVYFRPYKNVSKNSGFEYTNNKL